MKLILKLLLGCFISFPTIAISQDWQCMYEGVTTTFVDTTKLDSYYPTNTMWVVNIDSVKMHQGWKYHYGFKSFRINSITYAGYLFDICANSRGTSRMGIAMSAFGGENFFFNSEGYGIRISTLRQPNEPWICCRINDTTHLYATVKSVGIENILGKTDSVKYISFQAKKIAGDSVAHPLNNQLFKLSKHFGMLTLYDFYTFPKYSIGYPFYAPVHLLAGISEPGNKTGLQNITKKDIFSFAPGDEFHTFKLEGRTNHFSGSQTFILNRVLDSVWNSTGDTVTYILKWNKNYWIGWEDQPHYFSRGIDTISYAVYSDNCNGLDYFPEQVMTCYDSSGKVHSIKSFSQMKNEAFNSRWRKFLHYEFEPAAYCADSLVGLKIRSHENVNLIPLRYYYYIEGCGGPYYSVNDYDPIYHSSTEYFKILIYFKKGTESWGTPLDTTYWHDTQETPDILLTTFKVYPNPCNDQLTIEVPENYENNLRLEIYSIIGVKVDEIAITEVKSFINIGKYKKGIYFFRLFMGNQPVGQQKLFKH